jgi:hypothetical protein
MGRMYSLSEPSFTVGTGNVFAAIRTAADAVTAAGMLKIHRIMIGQSGTTTAEMCRVVVGARDTAGTLTMTATAPRPLHLGGPASAITGATAPAGTASRSGTDSSADSGGTYTDTIQDTFHNLNGWLYIPTPEDRIIVPPASVFVIRLAATPTGTTGWHFSCVFEEMV